MTTRIRRSLLLSAAVIVAVVAVACGGSSSGNDTSTPSSAEAQTPGVTPSGQTPAAKVTQQPSASGTPVSINADALQNLRSYRYHVTFDMSGAGTDQAIGFDQTGAFVAPDRSSAKCTGGFGDLLKIQEEDITIGNQTWVKDDTTNGSFQLKTDQGSATCTFTPQDILSSFSSTDFSGIKGSKETVNGVSAVRYDMDETSAKQMLDVARALGAAQDPSSLPPDLKFTFSVWIADDGGYPVRELLDMSGTMAPTPTDPQAAATPQQFTFKVETNITNVNDESIQINPP